MTTRKSKRKKAKLAAARAAKRMAVLPDPHRKAKAWTRFRRTAEEYRSDDDGSSDTDGLPGQNAYGLHVPRCHDTATYDEGESLWEFSSDDDEAYGTAPENPCSDETENSETGDNGDLRTTCWCGWAAEYPDGHGDWSMYGLDSGMSAIWYDFWDHSPSGPSAFADTLDHDVIHGADPP